MNLHISITAPGLDTVVVAALDDFVYGVDWSGDGVVETVYLFRRDRALQRNRGGRSDTVALTVERRHATLAAALQHMVSRRRDWRRIGIRSDLTAVIRAEYGTPVVVKLESATVTPGGSRMSGVTTIESLTLVGAIADTV